MAVFFRRVEVVGLEHVPAEGPVVFVGNHPNSLLDPVLLITTCGRPVSFAAKDVLFRAPFLRWVLWALGAVPVRRREDHPEAAADGRLDNRGAFAALDEVLAAGGAFGIFPEGISHAGSELAPLKTGAARIALGAAAAGRPVRVVPCGLSYYRRTRMRGRVLVQYGPPLRVDAARVAAWREDPQAAARALTADIDTALRALTINAPDFETLRVLDGVRRLYVPVGEEPPLAAQAEITRRLLDRYQELEDDPEVREVDAGVRDYLSRLEVLGLTDEQLAGPGPSRALGLLRHAFLMLVLAPLAIPGLVLHLPVLAVAVVAGDGLTRRRDVRATTKVITSVLLILPAYALIVGAVLLALAPPDAYVAAGATAALLPTTLWAAIRVLERQAALRRGAWALFALATLPREVGRLRAERARLRGRIVALVERYADPSLERLVPTEGSA